METTKCPHCGTVVPRTTFCIKCGKKLDENSNFRPKNNISTILCPNCKNTVPKTDFCISCGKNISKIQKSKQNGQELEDKEINTEVCPLCRKEIPSKHNFCHFCGARIKKKQEDQKQSVICNRCWKTNPPDTGYCIHCGNQTIGKKPYRADILEKPFEGYQFDLSQIFKTATIPLSLIRQTLSDDNTPIKSTIVQSSYFSIKSQKQRPNLLSRNFGGFDNKNLINYLGVFVLTLIIYLFWYTSRYNSTNLENSLLSETPLLILAALVLTILLIIPVWFSTFLVYRNSGYRLDFRLDSSKIFITVIFNILWMFFGYGPILLRMGEFKNPNERILRQKSFIRGIAWGSIFAVICSVSLAILTILVIGWPGWFSGFIFQDQLIGNHILPVYFGSIWISITALLPLGDYYDKVIKRWNLVGYLILLGIGFLLLTHYFRMIEIISQPTYQI